MNNPVKQFQLAVAAQPLPKTVKTRSGIAFDPAQSVWSFRDGTTAVHLNFDLLPQPCAPLLIGFKKTLIWTLEHKSPGSAITRFNALLAVLRHMIAGRKGAMSHIAKGDIERVKALDDGDALLSGVRSFLCKWGELGAPGIDREVVNALRKIVLKHHETGVAVATLDAKKGPLTDLEFEAIQAALNNAYSRGNLDESTLLLCYLFMSFGARPVQIASLKCRDLIPPESPDGDYVLMMPRAKQEGQLARGSFKARRVSRHLGEPLAAYVAAITTAFAGTFQDSGDAPMFPQQRRLHNANAPGFQYHCSPNLLSSRVVRSFRTLAVPSERLDEPIPATPIRFRRTFATRAAEEGWSQLVLAELMDHSDTRHVQVYAGLTTRIRANFSRKIALEMAPLAMAFAGKLIRNESEATRPGTSSRIIDLRVDRSGASMGSCGTHAHCGFLRPIACYAGCADFEPWLDGPHDAALDYMLARRESQLINADLRIAAINDRAILGCAQVILRCRELRGERSR